MLVRIGIITLLMVALSATGHSQPAAAKKNGGPALPSTRPPIFINNNASLYTFPNPNFGLPGQLAYAFVAVAHEDCRLFNNGATLMPKHRLIAAECMQGGAGGGGGMGGGGGGGGGPVAIDPLTGLPIQLNGINYQRAMRQRMLAAQAAYGGGYGGYGQPGNAGYASYPMQPEPMLTTTTNNAVAEDAVAKPRQYKGFGSFREFRYGGFATMFTTTDSSREFGKGFEADDAASTKKEKTEK